MKPIGNDIRWKIIRPNDSVRSGVLLNKELYVYDTVEVPVFNCIFQIKNNIRLNISNNLKIYEIS